LASSQNNVLFMQSCVLHYSQSVNVFATLFYTLLLCYIAHTESKSEILILIIWLLNKPFKFDLDF